MRWSKSLKAILSSDCRLKLAYMKRELLVIADQNAAVNAFPGLVHMPLMPRATHVLQWVVQRAAKP